jgi:subtilisin family serine protease
MWVIAGGARPLSGQAPSGRTPGPRISEVASPGIDNGLREAPSRRIDAAAAAARLRTPRAARSYLDGSIVVKFRAGATPAARAALLAVVDGRATARPANAPFDLVTLDGGADPEAVAQRLSAQPDVEYAQARYLVRPMAFRPNDPLYSLQWNYPLIDMERAWDINPGASSEVIVAVLDTGMAYTNIAFDYTQNVPQSIDGVVYPALGKVNLTSAAAPDLVTPGRIVSPFDFIWGDTSPVDMDGHGTHVAGTIGQLTNNSTGVAGMAFNVKLMPIKVLAGFWDDYFLSPFVGTDDTVALGIRYAVDNGAKVLNMSIGREGPPAPVVRDAIAYAVSKGAFMALAGGNDFLDGNPVPQFAAYATEFEGVVSVGAIGRDRQRAVYSGTGSWLELMAPGGDVTRNGVPGMILQQTYDFDFTDTFANGAAGFHAPRFDVFEYIYYEGTSMATAHVSGMAALLYQQGITKPAAIEAAMKRSATDLGTTGRDNEFGSGLINPRAALRGLGIVR